MLTKTIKDALKKRGVYLQRTDYLKEDAYSETYDEQSLAQKRFVNVGSGDFSHPYWTNLDFVSDWYGPRQKDVINFDLTKNKPLPFAENSLEIIYTSHTIEHVPFESSMNLFREAFKCLKTGGVLRVTTGPDADTDFRALQNGDKDWFYWDGEYQRHGDVTKTFKIPPETAPLAERWLNHAFNELSYNDLTPTNKKYTEAEILNLINEKGFPEVLNWFESQITFSPDNPQNHVTWWNHDRLQGAIKDAGFENVYRSGFWQSVSPVMRRTPLFDTTHPQMSIYVEAVK